MEKEYVPADEKKDMADDPNVMRCATWRLVEEPGKLPYVVIWVGLHKLPSLQHFASFDGAQKHANYLIKLGREPAILLDVNSMERIT